MKFSKNTLETLKNFAAINNGVVLKPGKFQRTIDQESTIYLETELEDEIPVQVALYELPQFLGILSQLENPELTFEESSVTISDGDVTIKYWYAEPDLIATPPEDMRLEVKTLTSEFEISKESMQKIIKLANSIALDTMTIFGQAGRIKVAVSSQDSFDESVESTYALKDVGEYSGDDFKISVKVENLIIIPDDYTVRVDEKRLVEFSNKLRYYVVARLKPKK